MSDPQLPEFDSEDKPNQPPHFQFPKREFDKTKIVKRSFQAEGSDTISNLVHGFRDFKS